MIFKVSEHASFNSEFVTEAKAYLFTKWFCLFGSNAGFYTETLRTATEFFI